MIEKLENRLSFKNTFIGTDGTVLRKNIFNRLYVRITKLLGSTRFDRLYVINKIFEDIKLAHNQYDSLSGEFRYSETFRRLFSKSLHGPLGLTTHEQHLRNLYITYKSYCPSLKSALDVYIKKAEQGFESQPVE